MSTFPLPSKAWVVSISQIKGERMEKMEMTWQPIETAPKDGTWILARHTDAKGDQGNNWPGRIFVVKHLGYTRTFGYDMGWALFPGMGVGDDSLSHWMPLPQPPEVNE